jgi:fructokinase
VPFAQIDATHDGSAMLVDGRADTVRLSDTDFVFLYESGYARKAAALFAADTGPFVITRRAQGVQGWQRQACMIEVEAPRVAVVDTVGAGETFQAGLVALRAIGRVRAAPLARMSADELQHALGFAAACAAIIWGGFGAYPPRLSEMGAGLIDTFLGKCSVPG